MRPSLYGGTDCSELHRLYYYGSWCSESQAEMAASLFLSNGIFNIGKGHSGDRIRESYTSIFLHVF